MKRLSIISFSFAIALLSSCGSNNKDAQTDSTVTDSTSYNVPADSGALDEQKQFQYDLTISNIPIPFDILTVLNKSGVNFNSSVLNSPKNKAKYANNTLKALNLGIYGGDLAYVISFEQYSEVSAYLNVAKNLADELGIPLAFDQKALIKFEKFKNNRDSLEKIIFESYSVVDNSLKTNERIGLATLVLTGGWIEGLYTSVKTVGSAAKNEQNNSLYDKIWEQRNHLSKILELLNAFNDQDPFYSDLKNDLKPLSDIYSSIASKTDMNSDNLAKIVPVVTTLRNKYTK